MFAGFQLLFQPRPLRNPPAQLREGSASAMTGANPNDPAPQAVAADLAADHKLIPAIAENLKQLYVNRAIGQQLADRLLASDKKGEYASLGMGTDLATRLNRDIQSITRALGVPAGVFVADVIYSARPLPSGPAPPLTEEMRERRRAALLLQNCLFERIDVLPRNIGYIKLTGFADAIACQETTGRAMASLNNVDALIVDLRDNGGGFGETALQIAGYLFDRPNIHVRSPSELSSSRHNRIAGFRGTGSPTSPCTS
jgi:hypothetical protein